MRGFTLVELVLVLVLVGALSAAGLSLFARTSDYTARTARDVLLNIGLLAQQRALGTVGSANDNQVTLKVVQTADEWQFTVSQKITDNASATTTAYDTQTVERAGATLSINNSTLANGATYTLTLSAKARLANRVLFTFTGNNTTHVCFSTTGFPYPLACQT